MKILQVWMFAISDTRRAFKDAVVQQAFLKERRKNASLLNIDSHNATLPWKLQACRCEASFQKKWNYVKKKTHSKNKSANVQQTCSISLHQLLSWYLKPERLASLQMCCKLTWKLPLYWRFQACRKIISMLWLVDYFADWLITLLKLILAARKLAASLEFPFVGCIHHSKFVTSAVVQKMENVSQDFEKKNIENILLMHFPPKTINIHVGNSETWVSTV